VNAMVDKYPHKLQFNDAGREPFDRIAALMDFDDWKNAIVYSGDIIVAMRRTNRQRQY
jgi:hypothetical protein